MRLISLFTALCLVPAASFAALTDGNLLQENVITAGTLSRPISMVFLSTNDLLIAEQHTGQVKRVTNGVVQGGSVLDLPVATESEQGLLSLVADPQFAVNSFIYLYYTRAASDGGADIDHKIMKYTWNGSTLTSPVTVLTLPSTPGGPNHNGGVLVFGPPTVAAANQKLFAVIGDLNRNGKTENYSSGVDADDTGVIMRINTDGTTPSDNPFFGVAGANAALQRVYAYGVRNCFGLDFDPATGALWDTENGPGGPAYDEVNRADPGFNSGWEYIMGPTSRNALMGAPSLYNFGAASTYSDPEFSWVGAVAPAAIHFLRGNGLGASYLNDCFVGDNNNGRIYKFEMTGPRTGFVLTATLADLVYDSGDSNTEILFGTGFGPVVDMDTGPDGNLYVLTLFGGPLYRIRSAVSAVGDWHLY